MFLYFHLYVLSTRMSLQFWEVGRPQGQASILYLHNFHSDNIFFSWTSFGPEIFYFWDFLQSVNSSELSEWTSVWCRTLIGNKWCACLGCFGSRSVTHASLNPTCIAVHFVHVCHQSACSSLSASSSSGMFAEASPILGWQLSGQQDGPNDPNGIQTAPFLLWKIISSWQSLMLEWN